MTTKEIRAAKTASAKRIKEAIKPFLHKSAFDGRLCHFGFIGASAISVKIDGFVLKEFEGFTENGVIDATQGGAMGWMKYNDLPLEDVLRIESVLPRCLKKLKGKYPEVIND